MQSQYPHKIKNGIEHIFRANSQNRIFAGYQAVFDDDQTDGLDKVSEDDINENNKTIPVTEDESLSCLDIMEKSHTIGTSTKI